MIKKILKKIFIIIVSLIAFVLIIGLFIPNKYEVLVSTTIRQPQRIVFDYVKLIKNQEHYSVWVMQDTTSKMMYEGTDGTVGFTASWNSTNDNVGEGSQTITKIDSNRIDVDLHFIRPFEGHDKAATILKAINDSTTEVSAVFYGNASYPMNIMSVIGKKIIRDAETQNLTNLKKILEH